MWLRWWLSEVRKESACNAWDPGSIPGSGRICGEGNGNPSCLTNPKDRGAWRATIHGVTRESGTTQWLNHHHHRWLAQDDTADQCWDQTGRFLVPGSFHIKLCQFAACLHISPGLCTKPPNLVSLLLSFFTASTLIYTSLFHGNKSYRWHESWTGSQITIKALSLSDSKHSKLFVDTDLWSMADKRIRDQVKRWPVFSASDYPGSCQSHTQEKGREKKALNCSLISWAQ